MLRKTAFLPPKPEDGKGRFRRDMAKACCGGVCMALAHTSSGQHYPNVFDDANSVYAIPAGVEYKLLYQETGSNCYILKEYPLDKSQLDWTIFG